MSRSNYFLFLPLILMSLQVFSQIKKGQWMIGGDAAFNYFKYYSTKTSALSLSPTGGYFVFNRLALGLRPGYEAEFYKSESGYKSRETFFSILPFGRYYFLTDDHKVNVFADAGFGYSRGRYKDQNSLVFSYGSKIISLKAGPAIFLNERTALEFTVGYNHSIRGSLGDTLGVSSFRIGVGFQIHIGKSKGD